MKYFYRNILIQKDQIKLDYFRISAKLEESKKTSFKRINYMSPDVLNEDFKNSTDIW